jgi:hypothetical protein
MGKIIRAKILKIDKMPSRYGGEVYVVYLKSPKDGRFKCWVSPENRNFERWREMCWNKKKVELDNLVVMNEDKKLVDADSLFKIIK